MVLKRKCLVGSLSRTIYDQGMKTNYIFSTFLFILLLNSACANLYHVQIGTIDNRFAGKSEEHIPFEIMLSETGVSTEDISSIGKAVGGNAGDSASAAAEAVGYFQMGPKTGNPVYNPKYAEKLIQEIHHKCPSGKISNLVSIREAMKYPVISGEIVKVKGVCRVAKKS